MCAHLEQETNSKNWADFLLPFVPFAIVGVLLQTLCLALDINIGFVVSTVVDFVSMAIRLAAGMVFVAIGVGLLSAIILFIFGDS